MNVKKFTTAIFVAFLTLISTFGFAQNSNHSTLGVYIGPNFSNVDITSPQLTADTKSGYQVGLFYRAGKFVYGQAGLQYQVMNSKFSLVDTTASNGTVMFRRIQMPLYGGLNLIPIIKGVFNIRPYVGPVISYDFNIPENSLDFTPSDFNRFRVDGTVGAGVDVLIFSLDAGYTFGFNDLFKNDFSGKSNYVFINAGLRF